MHKTVIVLRTDTDIEVWGSLSEACRVHNLSFNTLTRKKMPFNYRGVLFDRIPFKSKNGLRIRPNRTIFKLNLE